METGTKKCAPGLELALTNKKAPQFHTAGVPEEPKAKLRVVSPGVKNSLGRPRWLIKIPQHMDMCL